MENKGDKTGSAEVTMDKIVPEQIDQSNNAIVTNVSATENNTANGMDNKELDDLQNSLDNQAELFNNKKKEIEHRRQAAKDKVNKVYEKVKQVIDEKRDEIIGKIDVECDRAKELVTDYINDIESGKKIVKETCDSIDSDRAKVKNEIESSIEIRKDVLDNFHVPSLILNERSMKTLKGMSFGHFEDLSDGLLNTESHSCSDSEESETYESAAESEDYLENGESDDGKDCFDTDSPEKSNKMEESSESETPGCRHKHALSGESPAPYWKAMGLSKPPELPQPVDDDNLPDNKLQHLNSFSLLRQGDEHKLSLAAMTWNRGKICVADRANTKMRFFQPTGEMMTETVFDCSELRDMTFLDETHGETRYVLTSPRCKSVMVIGIDGENNVRIIHKLESPHRYSYVCRSPRPGTLLGAKVVSKSNKSVVNMFTFAGNILLTISKTPSYNQLQCVKALDVFGSNIIVLDGKINAVFVYKDDGRTVGEYRGTPEEPLVNPTDVSLDTKGNALILNGERSNIHVMNLQCNLIEIIKIPGSNIGKMPSRKLIAFDIESQRLAVARSNGEIAIFTFKGGYDCLTQQTPDPCLALPHQSVNSVWEPPQEVVPLVEGIVPSTIEDIMSRQRGRNRQRYMPYCPS
ncbi:uncharacterized protein LOC132756512 [Ruditapes philippinarum]|uniref:uncharacterized protein LOC132756512 n=1 Tax=Ruditapes philippinarum TaxID=129788 RepID=UPI00295C2F76|nr:uncharacterized protein LOC132756512 [Ruditapes philippinarum]XP_060603583.1 uncharacterized protein LOC132756512 [Ruditapes philippinarum]